MANVLVNRDSLQNIANEIKKKKGVDVNTPSYTPAAMAGEIATIKTGDAGAAQVVANEQGNFEVTKDDGSVTQVTSVYDENGRMTGVRYGDTNIPLQYEGENLRQIGDSTVNLDLAKITPSATLCDHTVYFKDQDDKLFEVASVIEGNKVFEPQQIPTGEGSILDGWYNHEIKQTFPFTPTENELELKAKFIQSHFAPLYSYFKVDKNKFPICIFDYSKWIKSAQVWFASSTEYFDKGRYGMGVMTTEDFLRCMTAMETFEVADVNDYDAIFHQFISTVSPTDIENLPGTYQDVLGYNAGENGEYVYANVDISQITGHFVLLT